MIEPIRDEFVATVKEVGELDENLVVLVGDISHFRLLPFAEKCHGRYYNIGICEPTIVNMAAGLSKVGFHPVLHTITPFLIERSYEQIKLDFGYQKYGVNIVAVGSAFDYTTLGCTHHCYVDFSLLKPLPDSEILFPSSPVEFNSLFKQTYSDGRITYFRIPRISHEVEFKADQIKLGKGIIVKEGKDATVVVIGSPLKMALEASEQLSKEGIDVEILYLHTIKPIDDELIAKSIAKTKNVLVVEEHSCHGGVSDDVVNITKEMDGVKYSFINIPADFIREYGKYEDLCATIGLNKDGIVAKIKTELLER